MDVGIYKEESQQKRHRSMASQDADSACRSLINYNPGASHAQNLQNPHCFLHTQSGTYLVY